MTTSLPIQTRQALCKTTTNNAKPSVFSVNPSMQPSPSINPNYYATAIDSTNCNHQNSTQVSHSTSSRSLSSGDEFLKRLRDFHRARQTSFRCLPTIAGQVIDLQELYTTVVSHGGWEKVNDRHLWQTIANHFGIDSSCLNGTQAFKNIYIRYLYAFEKISNGENIDSHEDDDEDSKRRNYSQLQRVPQSYNHSQHNVSDSVRAQYGLFRDFIRHNEYDKIELALLCGFPNELTFTINTLLLLSSTTANNPTPFHLHKCPRLLDILFHHIGIFSLKNNNFLTTLNDNIWSKHVKYSFEQFWVDSCSSDIVKQILNIDKNQKLKYFYENFNFYTNTNQQQQELRIEQVLMIIRNLSFDRTNALYLVDRLRSASTSLTSNFLFLTSYCERKIEFQKYAFDIWTNLAHYIHLRTISDDEGRSIRKLLNHMLNGDNEYGQQDRFKIIRACEIISKLAHSTNDNATYLMEFIGVIINKLIHVSDILILVHSLECLYQLSELGEQICNAIINVRSATSIITTLIDLLTIEARSFPPQIIKTIKIVELSTGPSLIQSYPQPPLPQQTSNTSQPVLVISANQQQTCSMENTEINKIHYANNNNNNNKFILQQQLSKPITVGTIINPTIQNTPTTCVALSNTNDRKRILDSVSESIVAVVNGTTSPIPPTTTPKRSSSSRRPRSTPTKSNNSISITNPSKPLPSSSIEDESSSAESNSTTNSVQSTIADILDRCSSPINTLDNDVRTCLDDLCQHVALKTDEPSLSANLNYNPIPSPVFKRKNEDQSSIGSKRMNKAINQNDEHTPKKKRNRSLKKSLANDTIVATIKKEEPIEQNIPDIKPQILPPNSIQLSDYICEWDNCRKSLPTARAVFHHACSNHVKHLSEYVCLWYGCDRIKRQKWALISHIQEKHCSEIAFRQAKSKATNSVPSINSNPIPSTNTNNSLPSTMPIGYAPDAAWLAVRRHMQKSSFDDLLIKNKEGPLTKSIRLTSALILRNIARHSPIGKQNLRQYEQHLTNLALEASEASSTLSSCLFELHN